MNKAVVERYMDGFRKGDDEQILSCLADDVVWDTVAEGAVRAERKDRGFLNAAFCDVFEMREGTIARLISYLVEVKP